MPKEKRIASHYYRLMSGHRYHSFKTGKDKDEYLFLDIKNDGGEITIIIVDNQKSDPIELYNLETNIYKYPLKKNTKYIVTIRSHSACGHYIMKKVIED